MTVPIMHLIYPGMTHSVPVIVGQPVTRPGYLGFVWTLDVNNPDAEPVATHCSRLSADPIGQLSAT